eukprot:SAG11_NODE_26668_length_342_cov_1.045267_1_plen_95_part_10
MLGRDPESQTRFLLNSDSATVLDRMPVHDVAIPRELRCPARFVLLPALGSHGSVTGIEAPPSIPSTNATGQHRKKQRTQNKTAVPHIAAACKIGR